MKIFATSVLLFSASLLSSTGASSTILRGNDKVSSFESVYVIVIHLMNIWSSTFIFFAMLTFDDDSSVPSVGFDPRHDWRGFKSIDFCSQRAYCKWFNSRIFIALSQLVHRKLTLFLLARNVFIQAEFERMMVAVRPRTQMILRIYG